jgi:hypothetical protein
MSFFDSLTSSSKLTAAIKTAAKARTKEGAQADFLFKEAYSSFGDLLKKQSGVADILYNWGFALLHEAQINNNDRAIALLDEASEKFSFCLTINPDYLGAAIDGGVCYMRLAEAMKAKADDDFFDSAESMFLTAERIQKGSASYNLACIYGLREEDEACQESFAKSRDHGSLPEIENILNDSDLDKVKGKAWFKKFIESLHKLKQQAEEEAEANKLVSSAKKQEKDSKKVENTQEKSEKSNKDKEAK